MGVNALNEISDIELMKVYKNIELNKYKESNNRNLLANAFNEISDIELMNFYKNIELDKIPTKIFEENKKLTKNLLVNALNEISDIELMKVYKNIELNKYKGSNNRNL